MKLAKILSIFIAFSLMFSCGSGNSDSNVSEWIKRNLNDSLTELVFPDINICWQAIYKKSSETEKEKQRSICNKMKENLLATSPDWVKKIKKYYDASLNDETKRNCIFDLWFKLNNEWKFASDAEMEQCIK